MARTGNLRGESIALEVVEATRGATRVVTTEEMGEPQAERVVATAMVVSVAEADVVGAAVVVGFQLFFSRAFTDIK